LYSDVASVQIITIQLANQLIDLLPTSVGINMNKAIIFDNISFYDACVSFKDNFELFISGSFGNVADK